MKKTLIATAVAAATFSTGVLAQAGAESADSRADVLAQRIDSMPEVYGNIQLVVLHENVDNGSSQLGHYDNGSTIGLTHDHEIAPGITGFFKAELEFDADDKAGNGGLNAFDEAYIGVKGDSFGQLWVGSDDSTFERAVDEIANYYEVATQNIGGGYDTGEGDLIQYMTPSFGGLKLHAAVQFNGDGDDNTSNDSSYPYQLAATFETGALEFAVAMDSNDGDRNYSRAFGQTNDAGVDIGTSTSNENTYGARASFEQDNVRATALFKTRDSNHIYGVIGYYTLGANAFAASWERFAPDVGEDVDVFSVQALHNLSDHMYVYVEGYLGTGDDYQGVNQDDKTDIAVGATYYF